MGIIGVVSVSTLPNLNSSTGEKEKVARIKKIYSDLSEAFGRAQVVYGPFDAWFKNDTTNAAQSTRMGERMTEFMKITKTCGLATNQGCFSPKPLLYTNGTKFEEESNDTLNFMYKIITADGMSIAFLALDNYHNYYIYVDTDGPNKGPNALAIDRFTFFIDNNELKPYTLYGDRSGAFNYYDIYIWAIENDNMDYIKCADKLNWQTQTSCK